jgi:class 3 adenylate cyclase
VPKKKKRIKQKSAAGAGPSAIRDDNLRDTAIMFADVIGASEVSNHVSVREYKEFVQEFKNIFNGACESYLGSWLDDLKEGADFSCSARGDEGILLIYPKANTHQASLLIDVAINIALELKRSWLLSKRNKDNVVAGIVPIELAVGIHWGQTYLAEGTEGGAEVIRPEGYAINLAKRVESFSRTGQYTHIFVSEAAHGLLNRLPDEKTYLFDEPKALSAKGFSREIRAFEVMHHFLPTDWTDGVEKPADNPWSNVLLRVSSPDDLRTYKAALQLNPTNVWLAEECIRASMLFEFKSLKRGDRENRERLREAYLYAMETISYLAQGDQRDPGILMIKGLICGESYDFDRERDCYKQAREFKRQVSVLDWYDGYAVSSEVWYEIGGDALEPDEIEAMTIDTIKPRKGSRFSTTDLGQKVIEATALLARAAEAARWSAWIHYTYGCELVMWGDDKARERGIAEVAYACTLLNDVKVEIANEPYLAKVNNDPKILSLQR